MFFPGVFLSSRVTGACPVTTDLIMRVNENNNNNNEAVVQHVTYVTDYCRVGRVVPFMGHELPAIFNFQARAS